MKIAVYGLEDFFAGKKIVPDERLDKLKELLHPPKVIYNNIEFIDSGHIKDSPIIVCLESKKDDLILMDLEYIEERLNRNPDEPEKQILVFCQGELNKESLLNELQFSQEQAKILGGLSFITIKPVVLVPDDKKNDAATIAKNAFSASGMISFFTVNEKELKAWPIKSATTAHEAAGCIHSDIQRGFIKAEVLHYEDIVRLGGVNQAKAQGLMKLEDKEYVVKDGDLIKFRFNI